VGGLIAAALARAGQEVLVVAREPTAAHISENGVRVRSVRLGEFTAYPAVAASLHEPVAVLLAATKATELGTALERIESEPQLVVPLLNGLDHLEVLRERFPDRVAAGVIRVESDRPRPGEIVQTSPFLRVDLAADDSALRPAVEALAQRLRRAEIPTQIGASEPQVMWSKLVRLVALACTTSAADEPIGFIRSDTEWRRLLEGCVNEAAAVAVADGANVDPSGTLGELDEAHPELGSSMRRDIAAGREPELDAIAGSVLREAARHGLACPTLARLSVRVAERAGIPAPRA
jgi:2-dehydropantoate 2-reductase